MNDSKFPLNPFKNSIYWESFSIDEIYISMILKSRFYFIFLTSFYQMENIYFLRDFHEVKEKSNDIFDFFSSLENQTSTNRIQIEEWRIRAADLLFCLFTNSILFNEIEKIEVNEIEQKLQEIISIFAPVQYNYDPDFNDNYSSGSNTSKISMLSVR